MANRETAIQIPAFFPETLKEALEQKAREISACGMLDLLRDLESSLDKNIHPEWKMLLGQLGEDAFEGVFQAAYTHKTQHLNVPDFEAIADKHKEIQALATKLAIILEKNEYVNKNLNNSLYFCVLDAIEESPFSPAQRALKTVMNKDSYPFRDGLPQVSRTLKKLALRAREAVSTANYEYLPRKSAAGTATRTFGIQLMLSSINESMPINNECLKAVGGILSHLHSDQPALSDDNVRKIWQGYTAKNSE